MSFHFFTLRKHTNIKMFVLTLLSRWRFSFYIHRGSLFILWRSYSPIRFALSTMVATLALISTSSNIWPRCISPERSLPLNYVTFQDVHQTNNYRLSEKIFCILCFHFLVVLILHLHYLRWLHNCFWKKCMLD